MIFYGYISGLVSEYNFFYVITCILPLIQNPVFPPFSNIGLLLKQERRQLWQVFDFLWWSELPGYWVKYWSITTVSYFFFFTIFKIILSILKLQVVCLSQDADMLTNPILAYDFFFPAQIWLLKQDQILYYGIW